MQAHATGARLPQVSFGAAQTWQLLPGAPAVRSAEQGRVLGASVDRIDIRWRWFEVPDAFKLPGVLRPIVPLVSAGDPFILEFVSNRRPGFAPIVRTLH